MVMELVELFTANTNIQEWSASEIQMLKEFSKSELNVILGTISQVTSDVPVLLQASSWE